FGYFFSTIANWIAAPFNGLLRTVSPYDKRIRLLTLTPEGKAILKRLTQVIETYQTRVSQNIAHRKTTSSSC
ncbi:hypothetical protein ABKW02_23580, partial [Enterobacter cloacae]